MVTETNSGSHPEAYREHRIQRNGFMLYVRDYPGAGPAFLLMHGFPDNLHIYDSLAPILARSGHRVLAFDFLGYGASDKPADYAYTASDLEFDIDAVVSAIEPDRVIPVAHDASGPAAINWGLAHPEHVDSLVLLNTYYVANPSLRFPELISLFSDPVYSDLSDEIANDPAQLAWLLNFQGLHFMRGAPPDLQMNAQKVLFPIIQAQFGGDSNVLPAFRSLTRDLPSSLLSNARRVSELERFAPPVNIIWGAGDPYLNPGVAKHLHTLFPTSKLALLQLGHWPQIDGPEEVARAILGPEGERIR